MKNYPEHEKLEKIQEQSQWLGSFIEWLGEKEMFLAKYSDDDVEYPRIIIVNKSINDLLANYFNIDLIKIEKEKQSMLKLIQKQNEK